MKLEDFDNTIRNLDSRSIRESCALEAGLKISNDVWANWRSLCGVPKNAHKLTRREAILLLTCATLRRQNPRAKLSALKIKISAQQRISQVGAKVLEVLELIDRPVEGRHLASWLQRVTGGRFSERTFYRWAEMGKAPRYSRSREYDPRDLRRWIRAAGYDPQEFAA